MTKAGIERRIDSLLKKCLPYEWYQVINIKYSHMANKDKELAYKLPYFHSRKRSKEKYCIFRFVWGNYAHFSAANCYVFAYEWAVRRGYIPLVDMEHEYCFKTGHMDEENMWELVFEQPISVREALKKEWVLVKGIERKDEWLASTCMDINGEEDNHRIHIVTDNWREYYAKVNGYISKSWRFRQDLLEEFEREYGEIFGGGPVLGVALREEFSVDVEKLRESANVSAETVRVYRKHPKTMGVMDVIRLVREYSASHNCSRIFLSTMYEESLQAFVEAFGQRVVWVERERHSVNINKFTDFERNIEEQYYYVKATYSKEQVKEQNITYAKEVLGLSRCDFLIGAPAGGTIAALSLNGGKYKDIYILPDLNKSKKY